MAEGTYGAGSRVNRAKRHVGSISIRELPSPPAVVRRKTTEDPSMAYERNPNDPYRPNMADEELQRIQRLDRELQADPELGEGPASGGKVAMFAIAIAVVLGAVFYGLNNSSMNPAGTGSTATAPATQNTAQTNPAAPPGMRGVTPRSNTEPGKTTGAGPARPQQPAANAPTKPADSDSAKPDAPAK